MNPSAMAAALPGAVSKSTPHLYRDCLRLARHIGGDSAKGLGLRAMVRTEFKKNKAVADPEAVEALRANAVRPHWFGALGGTAQHDAPAA